MTSEGILGSIQVDLAGINSPLREDCHKNWRDTGGNIKTTSFLSASRSSRFNSVPEIYSTCSYARSPQRLKKGLRTISSNSSNRSALPFLLDVSPLKGFSFLHFPLWYKSKISIPDSRRC